MKYAPPKWIEKVLHRFIDPKLLESVLGDLHEKFERRLERSIPLVFVQFQYLLESIGFVRMARSKTNFTTNSIGMYQHYFKMTFRNLKNNKLSGFINITGLAAGIACSVLIALWVFHEVTFDSFHPNADTIHQVMVNTTIDGSKRTAPPLPIPTYDALKTAHPNIKNVVLTNRGIDVVLNSRDKRFTKRGLFVTPEFLEIFQFPLLSGNKEKVLADPTAIVITRSLAVTLFGSDDPIGQQIRVDNESNFTVQAVLEDIPSNSTLQFDCLIPFHALQQATWVQRAMNNWSFSAFLVYVELNEPDNAGDVENSIKDLLTANGQVDVKRELFLYPMKHWHLYSTFENGKAIGGIIDFIRLFAIIAIVIVVMACMNFVNLATAQSERKAKETGIRKSIGSVRAQLVQRFLSESFLIVFIAIVLAFLLVEIVLPYYNEMLSKTLSINYLSSSFWFAAIGLLVLIGLLSGLYPAFYLSSFNPIKGLRNQAVLSTQKVSLKKTLIVLQCGFSMALIISAIIFQQQINLGKDRHIGYNKENLITISYTNEIDSSYQIIKRELLSSGAVESVTKSNSAVTQIQATNWVNWPGQDPEQRVSFVHIATEYDYAKTLGAKMFMGRDFSEEFPSDSSGIIINKAALTLMGLQNPLGEKIQLTGNTYTIIGVIDDIIMIAPYQDVPPTCFVFNPRWIGSMTVRLNKDRSTQENLGTVEQIVQKYNGNNPFDFRFVDDEFEKKFTTINLIGSLANLFCGLAILISCLGLLGLTAFTVEKRTKEIGLRKILGAGIGHILFMIARDFSTAVVLSFLIFTPLAGYFLNKFLQRFPLRVSIDWWVYALAGISVLLLTLLISSIQTFKTASANPAQALKRND